LIVLPGTTTFLITLGVPGLTVTEPPRFWVMMMLSLKVSPVMTRADPLRTADTLLRTVRVSRRSRSIIRRRLLRIRFGALRSFGRRREIQFIVDTPDSRCDASVTTRRPNSTKEKDCMGG